MSCFVQVRPEKSIGKKKNCLGGVVVEGDEGEDHVFLMRGIQFVAGGVVWQYFLLRGMKWTRGGAKRVVEPGYKFPISQKIKRAISLFEIFSLIMHAISQFY